MPEVIANTSPLQYLFQLGLLDLLPELYREVLVPEGVIQELHNGALQGVALPEIHSLRWVRVCRVASAPLLSLAAGLEMGEREVLALAVECDSAQVIPDDALARRFAQRLLSPRLPFRAKPISSAV